jgi:hypothetical protein
LYVCVGFPETFLAVTVYVVATFTTEGLPDNTPVEVLKLIPVGVAEIEKLEIAPPVEFTVNPAAEPCLTVWVEADNVNTGAFTFTVNKKSCVAEPKAFLAVTVYVVATFTTDGLPDNAPVDVLKDIPVGVAEIEYVATPPVEFTVNPATSPWYTV